MINGRPLMLSLPRKTLGQKAEDPAMIGCIVVEIFNDKSVYRISGCTVDLDSVGR